MLYDKEAPFALWADDTLFWRKFMKKNNNAMEIAA